MYFESFLTGTGVDMICNRIGKPAPVYEKFHHPGQDKGLRPGYPLSRRKIGGSWRHPISRPRVGQEWRRTFY